MSRRTRVPPEEQWQDFGHSREKKESEQGKVPPFPPQRGREGEPLDPVMRKKMESSFGVDLSDVRVHNDSQAGEAAQSLNADAYAKGRDIYFAPGKFGPELLAHEVAHTIQQSDTGSQGTERESPSLESQASHAASRAMQDGTAEVSPAAAAPATQRQKTPGTLDPGLDTAMGADVMPRSFLPSQSVTLDGFDSDKATLTPGHQRMLNELATKLIDVFTHAPDSFVTITGHTDATDSEQHNMALGQQRADAVRNYLIAHGVPEDAMRAASLGESMLKIDTKKAEPRNRRVEVDVFQRSFRTRLPPLVATPMLEPPKPPAKPIDLFPKPDIHVPTKEEEAAENIRHNEELWKKAQELKKKEAEEAERHPPGNSLSDYFGNKARDLAKSMGLPKWIQDKAADFAQDLPAKGLQAIFNQVTADRNLDERTKDAVKKVLEALPQVKVH